MKYIIFFLAWTALSLSVHASPLILDSATVADVSLSSSDTVRTAGVGQQIRVRLSGKLSGSGKVLLNIDGIPMKDIPAERHDPAAGTYFFRLEPNSILASFYDFRRAVKKVKISIGDEAGNYIHVEKDNFSIRMYDSTYMTAGLVLAGLILFLLVWLIVGTNIIRDDSTCKHNAPYSLSRTQMAYWSAIVITSFVFLLVIRGETTQITGSTLILLGISMATAAVGKVIDQSDEQNKSIARHQDGCSGGFLNDILSDTNGVSIHRFQLLAFNLIMGVVFLHDVITELKMPQFDDGLLMLMGLSSGAYSGMKIMENKSAGSREPEDLVVKDEGDGKEGGVG